VKPFRVRVIVPLGLSETKWLKKRIACARPNEGHARCHTPIAREWSAGKGVSDGVKFRLPSA
jgi:hypothetical protein